MFVTLNKKKKVSVYFKIRESVIVKSGGIV